jgi:hypothetical protein
MQRRAERFLARQVRLIAQTFEQFHHRFIARIFKRTARDLLGLEQQCFGMAHVDLMLGW